MKRFLKFFKEANDLGLTKTIIAITIFFYLGSVFFEAIGLALILPIVSFIFTGDGLDNLISSSEAVKKILYYIDYIGFPTDKYSLIALLIVMILFRQVMIFGRGCWSAATMAKLVYQLRRRLFGDFLQVKEDYFKNNSSGTTINDLSLEVFRASAIMIKGVDIIGILTMFLAYVVLMILLSPKLTFLVLFSFLFSVVILRGLWLQSAKVGRFLTANNREFMSHVVERFSNLRLLKLTGNQLFEQEYVYKITSEQRDKHFKSGLLIALTNSCIEPIIFISAACILFGAVEIFNQGLMNIGLFSIIMIRGVPLARTGFAAWQAIEGSWASLKAVSSTIENLVNNKEDVSGSKKLSFVPPEIRFEKVDFFYEGREKKIIDSVSLKIKSGLMVALVGHSGAGKSTLVDFLPRLKKPYRGNIFLDDTNINNINIHDLRRKIAFLPQTPQILNGSIRDHVCFGNPDIGDQDILMALEKAGCADLLEKLNFNIDTKVGSDGVLMSGGERQRLDLARVLARKAIILILDEPSASLDLITEQKIHEAINREREERAITVIVIGHRLKLFEKFDQIVVLKEGCIEAVGSHTEALKQSLWYKNAWSTQQLE